MLFFAQTTPQKIKVILDSDIGGGMDGALALSICIINNEVDLNAETFFK